MHDASRVYEVTHVGARTGLVFGQHGLHVVCRFPFSPTAKDVLSCLRMNSKLTLFGLYADPQGVLTLGCIWPVARLHEKLFLWLLRECSRCVNELWPVFGTVGAAGGDGRDPH